MATIASENAKRIREPMQVYIHLLAGSSASISSYTVTSAYSLNDNTLSNTSWPMRQLTDLANGGFPLDGSCEWYDASVVSSGTNGKLGVRGNAGENVVIQLTATATLTTVTIASSNVASIIVGGTTYEAIGLNVIPINAQTATITFTPNGANGRCEIDYIIPGAELTVTNDNLVSCNLALRSNLEITNNSWEESEIEFSIYYPYNIASSFAYIQTEWPITYQAGYDSDLSPVRKFYLSEPITQENNVITVHGVDASHLLENKTLPEQWITATPGKAHQVIYNKFISAIQSAGINLVNKQSWSGSDYWATRYAVLPEMTARDFVAGVMNLTLNHKRGSTYYGIQFVDAGIPSVEHGDGKTFGNTWTLYKSDCGDWTEQYEQNLATISNTNDERKFSETFNMSASKLVATFLESTVGQIIEANLDSYVYSPKLYAMARQYKIKTVITAGKVEKSLVPAGWLLTTNGAPTLITSSPMRVVMKANITTTDGDDRGNGIDGQPAIITGGVNSYTNPNGLPGIVAEMEPFIYGNLVDTGADPIFNYPSLFNRSLRTGSFKFKGDPRMQPLDYIDITNDTADGRGDVHARITGIELAHEGGGTEATITWREWS